MRLFLAILNISCLLCFSNKILANDFLLSLDESKALDKIGIDREQLDQMIETGDFSEIEDKIDKVKNEVKGRVQDYSKSRDQLKNHQAINDIEKELEETKGEFEEQAQALQSDLENSAEPLMMGYAASTVSLTLIAVFAPSVVMACRTKPSALAYVSTAAVYLTKELLNSQKFEASTLAEFKQVELEIDKARSIRSNIETANEALDLQFKFIQSYKNVIDKGLQSVREKSKNAKLASVGFGAASVAAFAENFAFDVGSCTGMASRSKPPAFLNPLDLVFGSKLYASENNEQIKVKTHTVSEDLKDNKMADLASDADKILAVLFGGVSLLAAQFLPGYQAILTKIVSSGVSRGIAFAAHSAMAFMAHKNLEESSDILIKRSNQLQKLIDQAHQRGQEGIDKLNEFLDSEDLNKGLKQLGVTDGKELGDLTPDEIEEKVESIETEKIETDVQEAIEEFRGSYLNRALEFLMGAFIERAWAQKKRNIELKCYTPQRCSGPTFPLFKDSKLTALNPFMKLQSSYSQSLFLGNGKEDKKVREKILAKQNELKNYQSQIFKTIAQKNSRLKETSLDELVALENGQMNKLTQRSLAGLEQNKIADQKVKRSKKEGRDQLPQKVQSPKLDSESKEISLDRSEFQTLMGLVKRLEKTQNDYMAKNYKINTVHKKESDLFKVIHKRYQQVFNRN